MQAVAKWAIEEFAAGFAAAVEGMAGTRPGVSSELLTGPPASESGWRQPLAGVSGEAFTVTSESDTLAIGQHVLAAAGIEDASPDELKSTFRECLSQAFSVLTRAMTTRLQHEVTPGSGADSQVIPTGLHWGSVRLTMGDQTAAISLGFPTQLLEAFISQPKPLAQAAGAGATSGPPSPPAVRATEESKTFDLLLDVELPVSVSFGHALVPLKDVLKLTTGSIVELSRAIIEPVDIVVNNCVIAKGEVVVVEGNFGVRIQQVISRSERLRSLQ